MINSGQTEKDGNNSGEGDSAGKKQGQGTGRTRRAQPIRLAASNGPENDRKGKVNAILNERR